jgi:nucleotide-binding universal stress UspA family protein
MSEHFHRILVPLDGSRLAEAVLPMAGLLARCLDAKVSLLHIIEERPPQTVHGEPHLTTVEQAQDYLTNVAQQLGPDLKVEQHVHGTEEQDVALSIASHAVELEADIIALCTHGRSGLRRVVSGSIAQQVLRRVTAPVLLVRPPMETPPALRTLLVPLDGTAQGEAALPVASEIASCCGATLNLVRVVPTVTTVTGDSSAAARLIPLSTSVTLDAEEAQARDYLASTLDRIEPGQKGTASEVRRGDTVQALAQAAATADLIVLATHARAGLEAMWIGSVAAGLSGKSTRPLLLVRIPENHPKP